MGMGWGGGGWKVLIPGIFWVRKFGKYFLGWLLGLKVAQMDFSG